MVACRPFGEVITALGSPITFGEEVAAIATEMNHRARRAFHKHAHLLCAPTALEERIRLRQTLVRGAAMLGGRPGRTQQPSSRPSTARRQHKSAG